MTVKKYPYAVVKNTGMENNKGMGQPAKKQKPLLQRLKWKRILVFSLAVLLIAKFTGGFFTIHDLKEQKAVLDEQLDAVRAVEAELTEKVQYLETDEAVERLAREKLGLVKPGEVIVVRAEDTK